MKTFFITTLLISLMFAGLSLKPLTSCDASPSILGGMCTAEHMSPTTVLPETLPELLLTILTFLIVLIVFRFVGGNLLVHINRILGRIPERHRLARRPLYADGGFLPYLYPMRDP